MNSSPNGCIVPKSNQAPSGVLRSLRRMLCLGRRGTAAIEFALASPLMLTIIGGIFDFGNAEYSRIALANAVSAGAEYALLTGTSVAAANIQTTVQATSSLPTANLTVTVTGPSYYCITGTTPTLTASSSGATCTDGSKAAAYVTISATYAINALMNAFTPQDAMTLTESATVRLS